MYIALVIAGAAALTCLAAAGIVAVLLARYRGLLVRHGTFSAKGSASRSDLRFRYADSRDENLERLRGTYDLDAVAGVGPETERIINVMKWAHRLSSHAANPAIRAELNALALIESCRTDKKKLNCWMYSIILNESYLALGFPSRIIHLLPRSGERRESHFVTAVFSSELAKWIMMDADMCGYLRDEHGAILGIPEIRRGLARGERFMVNEEVGVFSKRLGKWSYPAYLSKNIFRCSCRQDSEFGQESNDRNRMYVALLPDGYREDLLAEPQRTAKGSTIVYINDERLFWESPGGGAPP